MKLLKRHKDILNKLIKGKGQFITDRIKKEQTDGNTLSDIVKLYLQGLLTFQREYDIPWVGPSNEHKVRYKWYVITIDKNKTIKDLKQVIKNGQI
tara:strand:+ start:1012 stop:1296 length:285 start_codon:yes stop_codon:yes gene_type:complete